MHRLAIGGSASSKVVSGVISSSTTALAALSAVSLYSTSVCDFTFPTCVQGVWSLCLFVVYRLFVGGLSVGIVCKSPGLLCCHGLC